MDELVLILTSTAQLLSLCGGDMKDPTIVEQPQSAVSIWFWTHPCLGSLICHLLSSLVSCLHMMPILRVPFDASEEGEGAVADVTGPQLQMLFLKWLLV